MTIYVDVEWATLDSAANARILRAQYRGYTIHAGDSHGDIIGFRIYEPGHTTPIVSVDGMASLAIAQRAAIAAADKLPPLADQRR